jgi:hypothetical protein
MLFFASLVGTTIAKSQMILHTSLLGGLFGIMFESWFALFSGVVRGFALKRRCLLRLTSKIDLVPEASCQVEHEILIGKQD